MQPCARYYVLYNVVIRFACHLFMLAEEYSSNVHNQTSIIKFNKKQKLTGYRGFWRGMCIRFMQFLVMG